ncbi:MAG: TolC family protein [Endomicrobium sp.]|jgi:outer membrane protein TolC|nr:TolC family protein [Endomicrobium sp.]
MKIRPIVVLYFLLLGVVASTYAETKYLTIEDAIDFALQNNSKIQSAKQALQGAGYISSAAKGKFLPRLDIVAIGAKIDQSVNFNLNDIRAALIGASVASYSEAGGTHVAQFQQSLESSIPTFEKKILDDTFVRVMASVVQPLFSGFKVSANFNLKKMEESIAQTNLDATTSFTITDVVISYFKIKLLEQVSQIQNDYLKNIQTHVLHAKKLLRNGVISKANYLKSEVALSQAHRDYAQSLRDNELAYMFFNNVIGKTDEVLYLSSAIKVLKDLKEEKYYRDKSLQNNSSLKLLYIKKDMLKQKYKVYLGNMFPNIAAFGEYQLLQNKLTLVEPKWAVGINASLNIFGGCSDINEIKSAKLQIESVNSQIADVKNLIRIGIKNFYHRCKSAKQDYQTLVSGQALAEENLKFCRVAFKAGIATSLEVVDAELVCKKIKIDKAKAIFEYNNSYTNLINMCGMSPEEFKNEL